MLPSWPDLVGITILVGLVVVLSHAALARRPFTTARDEAAWRGVLAPLAGLLVLLLPYLPWLPDAVPALRALAGPGRFLVIGIVAGQMLWLAWDARRSAAPPRAGSPRRLGVVFLCGAAIYGVAAWRLTQTPIYPGGDEPHYLVIVQSLLGDGDLDIANNHERGDYRAYYPRSLKPDSIVPGRQGATYSIHPVGLPFLIAPAFALAGYPGAVAALVIIAALAAALVWQTAARLTGSDTAATVAWLAIYPEIPAALVAALAISWLADSHRLNRAIVAGFAIAALPWLSTKYALVALVLLAAAALRGYRSRAALVALIAPCAIAWTLWLYFFYALWGSPLPGAPYPPEHHMSLATLLVGGPGLFLDQEYGLLPYAPALVFAVPGLWRLWLDGGHRRFLGVITTLALAVLAATVGAFHLWWGGSAPPARPLASGLPLLVVPIARWASHVAAAPIRTAVLRVTILAGMVITAAMIAARGGLLIANNRNGSSQFLEWLEPARELSRVAPSFILAREHAWAAITTTVVWIAVLAVAAALLRRMRSLSGGGAAAATVLTGAAVLTIGAALATIAARGDLLPRLSPALRAESALLDHYDALRRPIAIRYTPFEPIDADAVPPLFSFDATPGARRARQPRPVLLNMRLSLPPGMYRATVEPVPGTALRGPIGLYIGRLGPVLYGWTTDLPAGITWQQTFRLPVDASFVGLRTPPDLAANVARVTIEPLSIVNASERPNLPVVLSAGDYHGVVVTFHDESVYPEENGFWVRGRSTLRATFALPADPARERGIRLTLHGGTNEGWVRFETPTWHERVRLEPGKRSEVTIPMLPGQQLAPVRIVTETGFTPAEAGTSADTRLLGCWVEVLP